MMDRAQIYSKLTTVFREVLDEDDIGLKPETTADDVDGWDSLSHIRLVLAAGSPRPSMAALSLGALCLGQIANLGIKKDLQLNGRAHYFYLHSS
jgi:acyl carrier protein